jgi:predicted class III extradiol MEMO1 family dioxygenase
MSVKSLFIIINTAFTTFLRRFHVTVFAIIVVGGLAIVVFMLNTIIIRSADTSDYVPETPSATFDQATIDRIEDLKTRNQADSELDLSGRTNPFIE